MPSSIGEALGNAKVNSYGCASFSFGVTMNRERSCASIQAFDDVRLQADGAVQLRAKLTFKMQIKWPSFGLFWTAIKPWSNAAQTGHELVPKALNDEQLAN